jgi:hypothetical protein
MSVTWMGFTARPQHQWAFIVRAVGQAESEEELGAIAAGPVECLLGWHGEDYIEAIEQSAASDSKFAQMMLGVCKYMMKEDVWARVQAIQSAASSRE